MLERGVPRFPDMPQMAIPPPKTANLNLFPYQYEYLVSPPLTTQDTTSHGPFIILLVLGMALLLLSLME